MRSHNNPSTTMTDRTPLMVGGKQASGFTADEDTSGFKAAVKKIVRYA